MKLSCQAEMRKFYMDHKTLPSFRVVREQLEGQLCDLLIEKCSKSQMNEMGLPELFRGPGGTLWTSPSDLLLGKVLLKPPLTLKYQRALTHEGILNFGEILEAKWLAQLQDEKEEALRTLEDMMMMMAAADQQIAVENIIQQLAGLQESRRPTIRGPDCAAQLQAQREFYEELLEETANDAQVMDEEDRKKLVDAAVEDCTKTLTSKFELDLGKQEEELLNIFKGRMEGQAERYKAEMANQQHVFEMVMKQLKHNIQCHNITSVLYVLCLERRKCLIEQQCIVKEMNAQMAKMHTSQKIAEKKLNRIQRELETTQKQLRLRHEVLQDLVVQFQKFINFALKAHPRQAEFLLDAEKMVTMELMQTLIKMKNSKPHIHFDRMIIDQQESDISTTETTTVLEDEELQSNVSSSDEDLTAVVYNKKVYVREDFRNRPLVDLPTETMLWNTDVQNLVKLQSEEELQSVGEKKLTRESPVVSRHLSSVHFIESAEPNSTGLLGTRDSLEIKNDAHLDVEDEEEEKRDTDVSLICAVDSITMMRTKTASRSTMTISHPTDKETFRSIESEANLQLTKSKRELNELHATLVETLEIAADNKDEKRSSAKHARIMQMAAPILKSPRRNSESITNLDRTTESKKYQSRVSILNLHRDSHELIAKQMERKKSLVKAPTQNMNTISSLSLHIDSHDLISERIDPALRKDNRIKDGAKQKESRKSRGSVVSFSPAEKFEENDESYRENRNVSRLSCHRDSLELIAIQIESRKSLDKELSSSSSLSAKGDDAEVRIEDRNMSSFSCHRDSFEIIAKQMENSRNRKEKIDGNVSGHSKSSEDMNTPFASHRDSFEVIAKQIGTRKEEFKIWSGHDFCKHRDSFEVIAKQMADRKRSIKKENSPIRTQSRSQKNSGKVVTETDDLGERRTWSKLSFHRDSLEIIAKQKKKPAKKKVKGSVIPSFALDSESPAKHCIINLPTFSEVPAIGFEHVLKVFDECSLPEKPWLIYRKAETPKHSAKPVKPHRKNTKSLHRNIADDIVERKSWNYLEKPNEAKILGDSKMEDYQTTSDFTLHRIHSLVEILAKDDSLMRMFTRGGH